ncbi:MAG TPA: hypothetical protein VG274_12185 [Rhizomicrobium sp.]|nr:hypothetical protein [Rhizomicrobium sp.]
MLTGNEIREKGLIVGAMEAGFRASSYDVHIESLIDSNGLVLESYALPAQGIVQAVSRERVVLPGDITGLAMVKTGLCNEGVLALNIGVIDPGWEGKISSFLVNFSNHERLLIAGETFLRLTFQQLGAETSSRNPVSDEAYVADRRRQAVGKFGTTFLNLTEATKAATEESFRQWRTSIFAYATPAALLLALLTFFLNFGSLYLIRTWLEPSATVEAELARDTLSKNEAGLVQENRALANRVQALEERIGESTVARPNAASPQPTRIPPPGPPK